ACNLWLACENFRAAIDEKRTGKRISILFNTGGSGGDAFNLERCEAILILLVIRITEETHRIRIFAHPTRQLIIVFGGNHLTGTNANSIIANHRSAITSKDCFDKKIEGAATGSRYKALNWLI